MGRSVRDQDNSEGWFSKTIFGPRLLARLELHGQKSIYISQMTLSQPLTSRRIAKLCRSGASRVISIGDGGDTFLEENLMDFLTTRWDCLLHAVCLFFTVQWFLSRFELTRSPIMTSLSTENQKILRSPQISLVLVPTTSFCRRLVRFFLRKMGLATRITDRCVKNNLRWNINKLQIQAENTETAANGIFFPRA